MKAISCGQCLDLTPSPCETSAIETVLARQAGDPEPCAVAAILGGPAVDLVGALYLKMDHPPPLGPGVRPTLILILVAFLERISLAGREA